MFVDGIKRETVQQRDHILSQPAAFRFPWQYCPKWCVPCDLGRKMGGIRWTADATHWWADQKMVLLLLWWRRIHFHR